MKVFGKETVKLEAWGVSRCFSDKDWEWEKHLYGGEEDRLNVLCKFY